MTYLVYGVPTSIIYGDNKLLGALIVDVYSNLQDSDFHSVFICTYDWLYDKRLSCFVNYIRIKCSPEDIIGATNWSIVWYKYANLIRHITGFVARETRRVSRVERELLTLPKHRVHPRFLVFSGVCVTRSLVFCVIFCRSLFVLLFFFFFVGHCVVCPFSINRF